MRKTFLRQENLGDQFTQPLGEVKHFLESNSKDDTQKVFAKGTLNGMVIGVGDSTYELRGIGGSKPDPSQEIRRAARAMDIDQSFAEELVEREVSVSAARLELAKRAMQDAGIPFTESPTAPTPEDAARYLDRIPAISSFGTERPQCVVAGMIPQGATIMLSGDPGSGKSTLSLSLAHAVAHGLNFAGRPTIKSPSVYLDLENPQSVVLERMRQLELSESPTFKIRGAWDWKNHLDAGEFERIAQWMRATGEKPLIVIDSASKFIEGSVGPDDGVKRLFMALDPLKFMGASNVLLHNTGKGENTHFWLGSSVFGHFFDNAYLVVNKSPSIALLKRIVLEAHTKSRYRVDAEIPLKFHDGENGDKANLGFPQTPLPRIPPPRTI